MLNDPTPHGVYVTHYILLLLGILAAVAVAAMIIYVFYYYVCRGLFAPVRKARARVLRKGQREYDVDVPRNVGIPRWQSMLYDQVMTVLGRDTTTTVYESWDYFVVFLVKGQQMEFAVPESTYIDIYEGDEGVLEYKGTVFKYFLPLRPVNQSPGPPSPTP